MPSTGSTRTARPLANRRILVTDGEGKPALAALRSLARAGAVVDVLAQTPWAVSFASRYCAEQIVTAPEDDAQAWVECVAKVVRERGYDAMLLCGDAAAAHVSEHRELFEPHVKVLLPSKESVRTALNKASTLKLARQLGVPVPLTAFPADSSELERVAAGLEYPVVVKGTQGSGSSRVRYAASPQELVQRHREIAQMIPDGEPPLVQEQVRGEGVAYAGLFRDGVALAGFMWRRLKEFPASGGPSAVAQSIVDRDLAGHAQKLLGALSWTGVAMVEFKRDHRDGTPRLMEINPRLWGSVELTMRCGLDLPRLYAQACLGQFPGDPGYECGRRMSFLFPNALLLASASIADGARLLADMVLPRSSFDVCLDDLRTLPRQLSATFNRLREAVGQTPAAVVP
jgi:predicted ATP-grasp superfamily ATP-dependent carboligase